MNKEKMQRLIRKSQHQFLQETNNQLSQITRELIMYLAGEQKEAFESLRQFFHRVKGTSGTLELPAVSVISEEIESLLTINKAASPQGQPLMYKLIRKTAELIEMIQKQLDEIETAANVKRQDTQSNLPAKVLVVADDISTLDQVEKILIEQGMAVYISSDPAETLGHLESETMDLAVIDCSLSEGPGIRLVEELTYTNSKTPVLFIGNSEQDKLKVDHQLYLSKPVQSKQLISLVQEQLTQSIKQFSDRFEEDFKLAFTRKQFAPHYEIEKKKFETYGDVFSVAFLDIDEFKAVNETYGHRYGEYILLCFTEIIRNHLPHDGKLYRFGEDEFLILFPETQGKKAKEIVEKIREELSVITFKATDNQSALNVTFSSGIAEYNTGTLNKKTLLEEADKALYRAKEKGSDQSILLSRSTKVTTNKILVVDDETLLANIIRTRLGYLGYEVDYAKDGQEALVKLAQDVYDLILLDIMLPKVTGIEVLKTFKNRNNDSDSKIIMISGKHSEAAVLESLKLGADDFFKKPFSLDVLEHKIKKILTS